MKKRNTNQEVCEISSALIRWFETQSIDPSLATIVMANVIASDLVAVAPTTELLDEGFALFGKTLGDPDCRQMGGLRMNNPFERLANAQMVAATKAKHKASEKRAAVKIVKSEREAPMKLSEMEQQVADQNKQMRAYRAWKKAEYDAIKHHPTYAAQWSEFTHRVLDLTPDNTNEFVSFLKSQIWLRDAELGIRRLALSFIANRIIRLRLENGYAPFDDSIPGEEPTALKSFERN